MVSVLSKATQIQGERHNFHGPIARDTDHSNSFFFLNHRFIHINGTIL